MATERTLDSLLSRTEASVRECSDAWAAWQETARNAGFAAPRIIRIISGGIGPGLTDIAPPPTRMPVRLIYDGAKMAPFAFVSYKAKR